MKKAVLLTDRPHPGDRVVHPGYGTGTALTCDPLKPDTIAIRWDTTMIPRDYKWKLMLGKLARE